MNRSTALTALALTSALALAGCADGAEETTDEAVSEITSSAPASPVTGGDQPASPSASTSIGEVSAEHNDADVMFAQGMIPHHRQAVEMSETLLAKEGVPEEVRVLAEGVIAAQGPEIERMEQMLEAWGEPTMMESGGMDHGSGGHGMAGMMSEEDMAALEQAEGAEAARLYLEQMTVHHEGAVEMARDEVANGTNPEAVELAEDVIAAQQTEIAEMDQMLQELSNQS